MWLTVLKRAAKDFLKDTCPQMNSVIIRNIVSIILHRRGIERKEPNAIDSKVVQVIQLHGQAMKISDAIAGAVKKCLYVRLINDSILVP